MTDTDLIKVIVNRAYRLAWQNKFLISPYQLRVALESIHKTEIKLDLEALLLADDEPFTRDVFGLLHNYDHATMKLRQGFAPKHIIRLEVA